MSKTIFLTPGRRWPKHFFLQMFPHWHLGFHLPCLDQCWIHQVWSNHFDFYSQWPHCQCLHCFVSFDPCLQKHCFRFLEHHCLPWLSAHRLKFFCQVHNPGNNNHLYITLHQKINCWRPQRQVEALEEEQEPPILLSVPDDSILSACVGENLNYLPWLLTKSLHGSFVLQCAATGKDAWVWVNGKQGKAGRSRTLQHNGRWCQVECGWWGKMAHHLEFFSVEKKRIRTW